MGTEDRIKKLDREIWAIAETLHSHRDALDELQKLFKGLSKQLNEIEADFIGAPHTDGDEVHVDHNGNYVTVYGAERWKKMQERKEDMIRKYLEAKKARRTSRNVEDVEEGTRAPEEAAVESGDQTESPQARETD